MKKQTLWLLVGVGALVLFEMQKNQASPSLSYVPASEPIGGAPGAGAATNLTPAGYGGGYLDYLAQPGGTPAPYDFIGAAYDAGMYRAAG